MRNTKFKMKIFIIILLCLVSFVQNIYINVERNSLSIITRKIKSELPIVLNLNRVFFINDERVGFLVIIQGKYTDVNEFNKNQYRVLFNDMFQNLKVTTISLIKSKENK